MQITKQKEKQNKQTTLRIPFKCYKRGVNRIDMTLRRSETMEPIKNDEQ